MRAFISPDGNYSGQRNLSDDGTKFISWFLVPTIVVKNIFDMYWDYEVFGIGINQTPYIWVVVGMAVHSSYLLANRLSLALIACSLITALLQILEGQFPDHVGTTRSLMSLLPLVIVVVTVKRWRASMGDPKGKNSRREEWYVLAWFGAFYVLCLIPNLIVVYQQMIGQAPVMDFDYIDNERVPRYSGAYSKPNNLAFSLLPLFVLGLCMLRDEYFGKTVKASALIAVLAISAAAHFLIGLRTFSAILGACAIIFLLRRSQLELASRAVLLAVTVYPLILLGSFTVFEKIVEGDLLRGRTDAWSGHLQDYLKWSFGDMLFGRGRVAYGGSADLGGYVEEFHNDYGRILITNGFMGLLVYIGVIRLYTQSISSAFRDKHILIRAHLSGIVALMMYSTTNEPTYYPAVFWSCLIIPILIAGGSMASIRPLEEYADERGSHR